MKKALFFGIAALSVHKTLLPILDELTLNGYALVYYNVEGFRPDSSFRGRFVPYSKGFIGDYANKVDVTTSYFEFGEMLLDMTNYLIDFLIKEVKKEKPDFIIHSHLAIWGKFIARHFNLINITLFTTFVLDKRVILPYFRKLNAEKKTTSSNIDSALRFNYKCKLINSRLGLNKQIDIWDTLVNSGQLNLSFILSCLQPKAGILGPTFKFLGYPMPIIKPNEHDSKTERKIIYVSMGTLTKTELSLYHILIDSLKKFQIKSVISLGSKTDITEFSEVPKNIEIVNFVDQRKLLKNAVLFISQGGMASVHESIYSITPMILIPLLPEQQITANNIKDLGIGEHLSIRELNKQRLQAEIGKILTNRSIYIKNIIKVGNSRPSKTPQALALKAINDLLKTVTTTEIDS